MSVYSPPSGYRIPAQPYSRFGYDSRSYLPARIGAMLAILLSTSVGPTPPPPPDPPSFASLFTSSLQVYQTDIGLLYGGVFLATAGNTATTVVALSGVISGVSVPIWIKSTNSASVGSGASFNVYYDGTGTAPAMTGLTPSPGVPIALTGAGLGLSIIFTAGTGVNNNTWKATCAGLTDQSGNFNDYSQLTPSKQPVITTGLNGKPGILFDGVDDILVSTLALPVPGTTPYCGFLVARRPTVAAAANRMIANNTADVVDLILDGPTNIHLFNGGTFGPTGTGLPTNTWGAIDFKYSNSAADYIQTGSGPVVSGAGAGNSAGSSQSISGTAVPANIEVLAGGFVPATAFSSANFRAFTTSEYGASVNV